MNRLTAIQLNGLNADSLGVYLSSLGLLSLLSRQWPDVRACWRNGRFCIVGGPESLQHIVDFVCEFGATNSWSVYDKPWDLAKRADVNPDPRLRK